MRQNTYTNAEKLLEAADQLAQSGECEEEEIYQAARDLELRMQVILTERVQKWKRVCRSSRPRMELILSFKHTVNILSENIIILKMFLTTLYSF